MICCMFVGRRDEARPDGSIYAAPSDKPLDCSRSCLSLTTPGKKLPLRFAKRFWPLAQRTEPPWDYSKTVLVNLSTSLTTFKITIDRASKERSQFHCATEEYQLRNAGIGWNGCLQNCSLNPVVCLGQAVDPYSSWIV